jgi:23S rRNA pseudouridine2605 synthase
MHPRFGVPKTYVVQVAGLPKKQDLQQLLKGVYLAEGRVRAHRVKRLKSHGQSVLLEIVLKEGKNREIRRMLARLGHKVLRLRRVAIGPVQMGHLPSGKARRLTKFELQRLQAASQPNELGSNPHSGPLPQGGREKDGES